MENTVIILRGLPGSGKTEFAFDLWGSMGATIVSANNYMVDDDGEYSFDIHKIPSSNDSCKSDFDTAIANEDNCIVVDNLNIQGWEFEQYKLDAVAKGYKVRVLTVENHHNGKSDDSVFSDNLTLISMARKFQHFLLPDSSRRVQDNV